MQCLRSMAASTPIAGTSDAHGSERAQSAQSAQSHRDHEPSTPALVAGYNSSESLESTIQLLKQISHQRFPSLADETGLEHARIHVTSRVQLQPPSLFRSAGQEEQLDPVALLRVVAYRLVTAYVDSDEVLVGELDQRGGTKFARPVWKEATDKRDASPTWRQAAALLAHHIEAARALSAAEVERALREADLKLEPGESPALLNFASFDLAARGEDWFPVNSLAMHVDVQDEDCWTVNVVADAVIFSMRAAELFARQLSHLVEQYASTPSEPFFEDGLGNFSLGSAFGDHSTPSVDDLSLLSAHEAPYDAEKAHLPILWLQKNARERPDALAHVLCEEPDSERQTLTFQELDQRSTQLANWLLDRKDVRNESRIGLCRPRDAHFYIAMAAILKAGCCYVPVSHPSALVRKKKKCT